MDQNKLINWTVYYYDYIGVSSSVIANGETKLDVEKELIASIANKFNIEIKTSLENFKSQKSEDNVFSITKIDDRCILVCRCGPIGNFTFVPHTNLPIVIKNITKFTKNCEHSQKEIKYTPTFDERINLDLKFGEEYFPQCLKEVRGASSKTIYSFFALNIQLRAYPQEVGDFSRNYILLKLYPEWRPRMKEMEVLGEEWKRLVENWDEIEEFYLMEKSKYKEKIISNEFCCGETNDKIKQCVGMG